MQTVTYTEAEAAGLGRYFTGHACARGHICERRTGSRKCCECERLKAYRYDRAHPAYCLLRNARSRARKLNLPCNLTINDIIVPKFCPVFPTIGLIHGKGVIQDSSPTLDRIRPELGYIRGNVRVISRLANRLKNNATLEQLMLLGDDARRIFIDQFVRQAA